MSSLKDLTQIASAVTISGGILNSSSGTEYVSKASAKLMGLGMSYSKEGTVQYVTKGHGYWKRAAIQSVSQALYAELIDYPRHRRYLKEAARRKEAIEASNTSTANTDSQYHKLIENRAKLSSAKNYSDKIVGNTVDDYLELKVNKNTTTKKYNSGTDSWVESTQVTDVTFVDLQAMVKISSKNNIVLTTVQGRDCTRKELISGGDLTISVSGLITSQYPDIFPEEEMSKFINLMQYKGVIDCANTILRQFKITQLIVLDYSVNPEEGYRNMVPYTINCVAVEPSEAVEVILEAEATAQKEISSHNSWFDIVKKIKKAADDYGNPSSLVIKATEKWL